MYLGIVADDFHRTSPSFDHQIRIHLVNEVATLQAAVEAEKVKVKRFWQLATLQANEIKLQFSYVASYCTYMSGHYTKLFAATKLRLKLVVLQLKPKLNSRQVTDCAYVILQQEFM